MIFPFLLCYNRVRCQRFRFRLCSASNRNSSYRLIAVAFGNFNGFGDLRTATILLIAPCFNGFPSKERFFLEFYGDLTLCCCAGIAPGKSLNRSNSIFNVEVAGRIVDLGHPAHDLGWVGVIGVNRHRQQTHGHTDKGSCSLPVHSTSPPFFVLIHQYEEGRRCETPFWQESILFFPQWFSDPLGQCFQTRYKGHDLSSKGS